jgi:uncharacterized protein
LPQRKKIMTPEEKEKNLQRQIARLKSVLIALSGGTDSAYLSHIAAGTDALHVLAATVQTPYMHQDEIQDARSFCLHNKIKHLVISLDMIGEIASNPEDRCYRCKKKMMENLRKIAGDYNIQTICDGTNADDLNDYRPGARALGEYGIFSPLKDAEMTKEDIRQCSRNAGLQTWNKPANACLLTRFPHNKEIAIQDLQNVEQAERFLDSLGFSGSRVRIHDKITRIELQPDHLEKPFPDECRRKVIQKFKQLGYQHITLDLEGYRTGTMDQERSS